VVLELNDEGSIAALKAGWRFLGFDAVSDFPFNARFILSGFPLEGASWDGHNVGQNFLMLSTDPLHYIPEVAFPEPSVDRFFYLERQGQMLNGDASQHSAPAGIERGVALGIFRARRLLVAIGGAQGRGRAEFSEAWGLDPKRRLGGRALHLQQAGTRVQRSAVPGMIVIRHHARVDGRCGEHRRGR
jgi:hypothetical protein